MKKILTNNLGLKILSLLIAFAVWLVVVNIDDPVITTTFSGINVDVINGDILKERGKIYEILNESNIIDVTVTGKRSVVESIAKDNIKAVADINDLSVMNTVEIKLSTNKNNDQLDALKSSTPTLDLNIENLKEKHLQIEIVTTGEPPAGYIVFDKMTSQNTIKVSGPESIIDKITHARVEVNIANRTTDISTTCDIKVYDNDGNVVESPYVTTNIKTVSFSASILQTKTVNIKYAYSGIPKDGFMVSGDIKAERQTIYIAGKKEYLDSISEITIKPEDINIDKAESSCTVTVDLNKYLGDGVRFVDSSFNGQVSVTVPIEKIEEQAYDVPISNITLKYSKDKYKAELIYEGEVFDDEDSKKATVPVTLEGIMKVLDAVDVKNIKGTVDVDEYILPLIADGKLSADSNAVSEHELPVEFVLPNGLEQSGADVKVRVRITIVE